MQEGLSPVTEVLAAVLDGIEPLPAVEVPTAEATGLVLAEDLIAPCELPRFDNAAMDGFAVRSRDVTEASAAAPVRLAVAGASFAGHAPGIVGPNEAAVIATGARLPDGADAVARVEVTRRDGGSVLVTSPVPAGRDIRWRGEDVNEGQVVAAAGRLMGPGAIAAAAAFGRTEVRVHPRPRVTVLLTGDEVALPGAVLGDGQVFDAAGPALLALVGEIGCRGRLAGPVSDRPDLIADALRIAAARSDAVITVGGASVGERDFLSRAAGTLGEFRSWLVALRPAKPFGFGRVLGVPLFGLPGNPAASVVAFEVLVRPALLRLLGRPPRARPSYPAELVDDVRQRPGRLHLVRARCWREGERRLVRAAGHQGAGTVGSLAAANAWMVLQPEVESLPAGSTVEVRPMWGEGPPEATDP